MSGTPAQRPPRADAVPRRVVAFGGGSGLPNVLRGLREHVGPGRIEDLTAIVAMTDDGGSSGRLRESLGIPPPGDVRNCLVALSRDEDLLAGLFQYRYAPSADDLGGHTVGNLILAALAEQTGCFLQAVEASSRVLRVAGRILPVTLQDVRLRAVLEDGSTIDGESAIGVSDRRVRRLILDPDDAKPTDGVVDATTGADLVVLGPGSLFTSVLPPLAMRAVAEAIRNSDGCVVLVGNLVGERGEAMGLGLAEHLDILERQVGGPVVDAVVVNDAPVDPEVARRYLDEGAVPLTWDDDRSDRVVVRGRMFEPGQRKLRHDPVATANALIDAWRSVRARRRAEPASELRSSDTMSTGG